MRQVPSFAPTQEEIADKIEAEKIRAKQQKIDDDDMNQARHEIESQRHGKDHNMSKAAPQNERDGVVTVKTASPLAPGAIGTVQFNAEKTPFAGHEYVTACFAFNGWSGDNRYVDMRKSSALGEQVRVCVVMLSRAAPAQCMRETSKKKQIHHRVESSVLTQGGLDVNEREVSCPSVSVAAAH